MLSFTKYGRDTIQLKQKTCTVLYDKFTQDNMYQLPNLMTTVIFVNENENGEKRENNEFVNEN